MEFTVKNQDGFETEVSVIINASDYQVLLDKSLKKEARTMDIPGFSQGNVQTSVVNTLAGNEIKAEIIGELLSDSIADYIEEKEMKLILGPVPTFDVEEMDWSQESFTFNFMICERPETPINLAPLNEITRYRISISDQDIDEEIEVLRIENELFDEVDFVDQEEIQEIEIAFIELNDDGQPLEGGFDEILPLRNEDIPAAFMELINGESIGYEAKIAISDFFKPEELEELFVMDEQEVRDLWPNFTIQIVRVDSVRLPELDQEFFDLYFQNGEVTTLDQFKERWKANMEDEWNLHATESFKDMLKAAILEQTNIEIPEGFLNAAYDYQKNLIVFEDDSDEDDLDYESDLDDDDPDYLDDLETRSFDRFVKTMKWRTILENIVEAQKIEVSIDDLIQYEMVRMQADDIIETDLSKDDLIALASDNLKDSTLRHRNSLEIIDEKVFDWIMSQIDPPVQTLTIQAFAEMSVE